MSLNSPALRIRLLKLKGKLSSGLGWLVLGPLALLAVVFLAVVFVGLPVAMVVGQGIGLWRMAAWNGETTGIVETVTVDRVYTHSGPDPLATHLAYSYTIAGKSYTGTAIGPEWNIIDAETHGDSLAQEFHRGQRIAVHYDPNHPEHAFLWPKIRKVLLGIPAGLLFVLASLAVRGWNWKRTARRKTIPACASIGLGAGGVALFLFLAPVYVEPWIAGALLGGGLVGGAIFGWWKGVPTRTDAPSTTPIYKQRKS